MENTSYLLHASLGSSSKRKRFSFEPRVEDAQYSVIQDPRIATAKSLRLECKMLTVVVGPVPEEEPVENREESLFIEDTRETFYVHEFAICDRSPFFEKAMKPEWAEKRTDPDTIELPDDDPTAFSIYLHWLYTRKLPVLPDDQESQSSEGFHNLAYAYVLGERLMDVEFKNAIADAYVLFARGTAPGKQHYPSNDDIKIIYEGTRFDSPIRQLLIDIWATRGKPEWLEDDPDLPTDFLVPVMKLLFKTRREQNESLSRPWKKQHDQYHDH